MTAFRKLHECQANYTAILELSTAFNERLDLLKTKTSIIIEPFTKPSDLAKFHGLKDGADIYSADGKHCINWHKNDFYILDLTDAMKPNEKLKDITVAYDGDNVFDFLNDLDKEYGTISAFVDAVTNKKTDTYEIKVYMVDAEKTFSPIAVSKLPRLVRIPTKWGKQDVMRVLANAQYTYFARNGRRRITDILKELEMINGDANFDKGITVKESDRRTALLSFPATKLSVDLGLG